MPNSPRRKSRGFPHTGTRSKPQGFCRGLSHPRRQPRIRTAPIRKRSVSRRTISPGFYPTPPIPRTVVVRIGCCSRTTKWGEGQLHQCRASEAEAQILRRRRGGADIFATRAEHGSFWPENFLSFPISNYRRRKPPEARVYRYHGWGRQNGDLSIDIAAGLTDSQGV